MSEKLFEHIEASKGKILAKLTDENELIYTNAVSAPLNTDLSDWLEFDSKEQAEGYYQQRKNSFDY